MTAAPNRVDNLKEFQHNAQFGAADAFAQRRMFYDPMRSPSHWDIGHTLNNHSNLSNLASRRKGHTQRTAGSIGYRVCFR